MCIRDRTSTRRITSVGFADKTGLDLNEGTRRERGLLPSVAEFKAVRALWAELTNEALRDAGLAQRVDPRSLAEQGIDRVPSHRPWHVYVAERAAMRQQALDRVRALYEQRAANEAAGRGTGAAESLDQVRRRAREAWLELRAGTAAPAPAATVGRAPTDALLRSAIAGRGRDDDIAL